MFVNTLSIYLAIILLFDNSAIIKGIKMTNKPIHEPVFSHEYVHNQAKKLGLLRLKISGPIERFSVIQNRIDFEVYKPLIAVNGGISGNVQIVNLQDDKGKRVGSISIVFIDGRYNAYENALKPFEPVSGPKEHLRHIPNDFSDITLVLNDSYIVSTRGNIILTGHTYDGTPVLELNKITMNMIFDKK